MKKKTMMSKEALALIVGAEESAPAEDTQELSEETVAEEVVETEAEATEGEEVTEPETEAEEEVPTVLASEMEAVQKELEDLKAESTETIKDLEAKVEEAGDSVKAIEEASENMKKIVVAQVSIMRNAMSVAAVDMTGWTVEAVVTEFNSISESFKKSYRPGSVVPEQVDNKNEAKAINSSVDASAYKSLGFK